MRAISFLAWALALSVLPARAEQPPQHGPGAAPAPNGRPMMPASPAGCSGIATKVAFAVAGITSGRACQDPENPPHPNATQMVDGKDKKLDQDHARLETFEVTVAPFRKIVVKLHHGLKLKGGDYCDLESIVRSADE